MASMTIEKESVMRKTALTSAPTTSALAQPYVFLYHFFGLILILTKAMRSAIRSLSM